MKYIRIVLETNWNMTFFFAFPFLNVFEKSSIVAVLVMGATTASAIVSLTLTVDTCGKERERWISCAKIARGREYANIAK